MRGPKFRGRLSVIVVILLVMFYLVHCYVTNIVSAEGEKNNPTFKVTVSIIGVTKETGDITAVVTVDGHSKVKTFRSDPGKLTSNSSTEWYALRFVAAFPNAVLDPGTVYKACAVKLKDMHQYCQEGKYSSDKSPEFVSIVLDKNIKSKMEKKHNVIIANDLTSDDTNEERRDVLPNYAK